MEENPYSTRAASQRVTAMQSCSYRRGASRSARGLKYFVYPQRVMDGVEWMKLWNIYVALSHYFLEDDFHKQVTNR